MSFELSLLVEVLGGIVTAGLLGVIVAWREGLAQVDRHDREIAAIDEDLRRFLRDRDRLVIAQTDALLTEATQGEMVPGLKIMPKVFDEPRQQALRDYRDEMTRKLRRYRDIRTSEGRIHSLARRRRSPERLELSAEGKRILYDWRQFGDKADDPTRLELEGDLRQFEAWGEPPEDLE